MCTVDKEFGYFNQLVGYLICMHANLIRYMPHVYTTLLYSKVTKFALVNFSVEMLLFTMTK